MGGSGLKKYVDSLVAGAEKSTPSGTSTELYELLYGEDISGRLPQSDLQDENSELSLLVQMSLNEQNKEALVPVLIAAKEGRVDVVEALLLFQDGNLDLKQKDPRGRNARQRAQGAGHEQIATLLKNFKFQRPKKVGESVGSSSLCTCRKY